MLGVICEIARPRLSDTRKNASPIILTRVLDMKGESVKLKEKRARDERGEERRRGPRKRKCYQVQVSWLQKRI